jgi:sugar/nucleoside kinase (ribokinase family)
VTRPPRLVCLGNLTLDDIVLPDGRERPGCIGGDALYAALAARRWEPATEMVAPVGLDLPTGIWASITNAGLSTIGLPRRSLPTLRNRVVYAMNGDRTWTLYATEEEFDILSPWPEDIPPSYRSAEAYLILAMTLSAQTALALHLRATSPGLIVLDPQEDYIRGNEEAMRRLIATTDIFMPSAEEARQLLGHEDWSLAARVFCEWGPSIVVVKLGPEGCLVYSRASGREFRRPAVATNVVDVTGAGDSFCGAFVATLLNDKSDLEGAATAGAQAAAIAISGYGVDPMFSALGSR